MTQTQPAFTPHDRLLTGRKSAPYCDSFQRQDIYHSLLIYKYSFSLLNVSHVSQDLKIKLLVMWGFMECTFVYFFLSQRIAYYSARALGTQSIFSFVLWGGFVCNYFNALPSHLRKDFKSYILQNSKCSVITLIG